MFEVPDFIKFGKTLMKLKIIKSDFQRGKRCLKSKKLCYYVVILRFSENHSFSALTNTKYDELFELRKLF